MKKSLLSLLPEIKCEKFGSHDFFLKGQGGIYRGDKNKFLYECKHCKMWLHTRELSQDDLDFYRNKYLAEHKELTP